MIQHRLKFVGDIVHFPFPDKWEDDEPGLIGMALGMLRIRKAMRLRLRGKKRRKAKA